MCNNIIFTITRLRPILIYFIVIHNNILNMNCVQYYIILKRPYYKQTARRLYVYYKPFYHPCRLLLLVFVSFRSMSFVTVEIGQNFLCSLLRAMTCHQRYNVCNVVITSDEPTKRLVKTQRLAGKSY